MSKQLSTFLRKYRLFTSSIAPHLALIVLLLSVAGGWTAARAQDMASFEKRTTTKVLPNGLTLIICERPEAPVFSFYTVVNAGDANDPSGDSGLAHMFEHLARGPGSGEAEAVARRL
jgi:hypothetical protein